MLVRVGESHPRNLPQRHKKFKTLQPLLDQIQRGPILFLLTTGRAQLAICVLDSLSLGGERDGQVGPALGFVLARDSTHDHGLLGMVQARACIRGLVFGSPEARQILSEVFFENVQRIQAGFDPMLDLITANCFGPIIGLGVFRGRFQRLSPEEGRGEIAW